MSDMLGRSRPYSNHMECCKKHGGPPDMSPKRRKEERVWRKDVEDQMEAEPDRRAGPLC